MGMKSKSAHFGSGSGGPSKREGGSKFKLNIQQFAKMPKQRAQLMHIMANRKGHLVDTPANRKILETMIEKYGGKPVGIDALATTVGEEVNHPFLTLNSIFWFYFKL